ncbi:hypothetical protein [Streptomyces capitiformicae]|uniref:Uncharacterized protein n=1 Tax=Streptomyces capitiformicae TaxID=2014920 RepID=A0A919GNB9_9ACTN|nr:hypothetical protein [Streptomyces capitiformicae]GHH87076.1 hypothetical protein GCM10017771_26790 [Streptomyces capitiformicae]
MRRLDPLPSQFGVPRPAAHRGPAAPTVRCWYEPLDGTSQALAHRYLAAYEHEEEAGVQPLRRDIHTHLGTAS